MGVGVGVGEGVGTGEGVGEMEDAFGVGFAVADCDGVLVFSAEQPLLTPTTMSPPMARLAIFRAADLCPSCLFPACWCRG